MRKKQIENIQQKIANNRLVIKKMHIQWNDEDLLFKITPGEKKRIWNQIQKQVWTESGQKHFFYYKLYSIAATLLLLIGFSYTVHMRHHLPEATLAETYIISSGIQNTQSVLLPDGTWVQLGPNSKLTYPQEFTKQERLVMVEGQAFFDVAKDPTKPFVVYSRKIRIEALGTAFEVFNYDSESRAEAILLQGSIQVDVPDKYTDEMVAKVLIPNEKIVFDQQTNELFKEKVDANKYTMWRNQGILGFENESLTMIIPRLEQWYGRKIICQKDLAEKYRFTFKVRDEPLEKILFMISESSPLRSVAIESGNYRLELKK